MDLEVPRSSRGGGTIKIKDLAREAQGRRFPETRLGSTWEATACLFGRLQLGLRARAAIVEIAWRHLPICGAELAGTYPSARGTRGGRKGICDPAFPDTRLTCPLRGIASIRS